MHHGNRNIHFPQMVTRCQNTNFDTTCNTRLFLTTSSRLFTYIPDQQTKRIQQNTFLYRLLRILTFKTSLSLYTVEMSFEDASYSLPCPRELSDIVLDNETINMLNTIINNSDDLTSAAFLRYYSFISLSLKQARS